MTVLFVVRRLNLPLERRIQASLLVRSIGVLEYCREVQLFVTLRPKNSMHILHIHRRM